MQLKERRQTISEIVAGYDPLTSDSLLLLSSCLADYCPIRGRLVVVFHHEVTNQDWATVLDHYGFHHDQYDYDYGIHNELHVIVLTRFTRPGVS